MLRHVTSFESARLFVMEALKVCKLLLLVLQLVNCLVAFAVVYVGVALIRNLAEYEVFTGTRNVAGPAAAAIIAGVVLLVVGVTGCVGAVKENTTALAVFCILQLVVVVIEVTGGAIAVAYNKQAKHHITIQFERYMNSSDRSHVDKAQKDLHCCGTTGPGSWTERNLTIPTSCCAWSNSSACFNNSTSNKITTTVSPATKYYSDGCVDSLFNLLKHNLVPIAGVTISFAFVQLCSGWIGVLMYRKRSREMRFQEMQETV